MSASLVGSEMCIRDRCCAERPSTEGARAAASSALPALEALAARYRRLKRCCLSLLVPQGPPDCVRQPLFR
eukprot:3047804-Alexandrium_andersonii.AAC.1